MPLYSVGVGSLAADCTEVTPAGYVRNGVSGQTYAIVRYWVPPGSFWALAAPWGTDAVQDLPIETLRQIPLDSTCPAPNMLVWLLDGRVLLYDADFDIWRHVLDIATFQVLDLRWCNVVSAHAGQTLTLGTAHPPTSVTPRAHYPAC